MPCLSLWGLLGIVSRLLGLTVLPVKVPYLDVDGEDASEVQAFEA
jgi:hypothetical protein